MLRNGPLPLFVHGVLEYVAAALFIAAPFLFGFDDIGAATAVSIVVGVAVLGLAATTDWVTAIVRSVPVSVHMVLDLLVGALLVASPFVFGFSDEEGPTAFFLIAGVVELLVWIATRWPSSRERTPRGSRRTEAPAEGTPSPPTAGQR